MTLSNDGRIRYNSLLLAHVTMYAAIRWSGGHQAEHYGRIVELFYTTLRYDIAALVVQ